MKNKYRFLGLFLGLLSMSIVACEDDIPALVEELDLDRALSPTELTAKIRNRTTVELEWELTEADSYVIEISPDSLEFTSIVVTQTVVAEDLPVQIQLDGETQYSARVKGVAEGKDESKWSAVVFETDPEQLFDEIDPANIAATTATLTWPAGSAVTHFIIEPGSVQRDISSAEAAAGSATITGLTGETEYTVTMYNGAKRRGTHVFTTNVDIGDAIAVNPEDDLAALIAAAQDGDSFALFPGEYTSKGEITISTSISIKAVYPYDKPVLNVQFNLENGITVSLSDLEMDGTYFDEGTSSDVALSNFMQLNTTAVAYGDITIEGCVIHDYGKSLITASSSIASTINSITISDCIVTNILTSGGDGIDVRGGYVASLTLQNSTFNNCAPGREFIRLDDTSGAYPGMNTDILIEYCTFNAVSGVSGDRMLYVRFQTNEIIVRNTLIANSEGKYSDQSRTDQAPDFSKNNYFNAALFFDSGETVFDGSGSLTTLDPGFADAANGDFTISNQDLIDDQVGDPRWR